MIVYRVEDASGQGPYNSPWAPENMPEVHTNNPTHPGPFNDIGWDWPYKLGDVHTIFGFESLEMLDAWFRGWKTRLRDHFEIHTYEVPEALVLKGRFQLAFDGDAAVRTGEVPMYARDRKELVHA